MAYELTYKLINNNTEYELTGYTGTPDVVDIPSTYNGKSVTTIGSSAFRECKSLTSITIPDSVTSIGSSAFYNCSNLNAVYITDLAAWCNISFGDYAENPLCYANNLYLNGQLVTKLVIPDGVTFISDWLFYLCKSLTSVTIPDSVTSIGDYAFRDCSNLTSVSIGDSVTSIGKWAFYDCNSLTSITIPDSVMTIGDGAFYFCDSLKSVTLLNTTPPALSFNSFNDISEDAKFYCFSSCLDAYKTATNWNKHADKFTTIKADMKLCFTMNAKAQKKYFASKNELKRIDTALKNCVEKDNNGNIIVSTPTEANHAATKQYVDDLIKSALTQSY